MRHILKQIKFIGTIILFILPTIISIVLFIHLYKLNQQIESLYLTRRNSIADNSSIKEHKVLKLNDLMIFVEYNNQLIIYQKDKLVFSSLSMNRSDTIDKMEEHLKFEVDKNIQKTGLDIDTKIAKNGEQLHNSTEKYKSEMDHNLKDKLDKNNNKDSNENDSIEKDSNEKDSNEKDTNISNLSDENDNNEKDCNNIVRNVKFINENDNQLDKYEIYNQKEYNENNIIKKDINNENEYEQINFPQVQKEQKQVIPEYDKPNQVKNNSDLKDTKVDEKLYQGKKVYLTFDDGPSIHTKAILDILNRYNVKATFFVIGKTDKFSKKIYKRIVNEGHTLGMHSYSHQYQLIYRSLEDFDKDFTKLRKLLYDTTGYMPVIYRFPGGSLNKVNKYGMDDFIRYLNQRSIQYYDWNVLNNDAIGKKYSEEQLIQHVLTGISNKDTSIVLMHDSETKELTMKSLPKLIEILLEQGAEILPIDSNTPLIQQIKASTIK